MGFRAGDEIEGAETICIEAEDPKVEDLDIQAFLAELGGSAIETIVDEEAGDE